MDFSIFNKSKEIPKEMLLTQCYVAYLVTYVFLPSYFFYFFTH